MIKAVIFDYFGVVSSDEYWNYVKAERQQDSVFREIADDVNKGKISWNEFVENVAKSTGTSVDEVNKMYAAESVNPLVTGLIHELHKKYKTGLLTNASEEFIDKLIQQNHLKRLFDEIVISSVVGVTKPNPKIYQEILSRLNIEPEEAIYVDDLIRHVEGASNLGMHAIQYQSFVQCKREIDKIIAKTV